MRKETVIQNIRTHIPFQQKIEMFFVHHFQAALSSLGKMYRTPIASILTALVIAIALALPAGLYVFVNNITAITQQWEIQPQISLFMQQSLSEQQVLATAEKLQQNNLIKKIDYISPAQGWEMFQQTAGMTEVMSALPDNPLPAVLVVTPRNMDDSQKLVAQLQQVKDIEFVQLDSAWVERLQGFLKLGQQITSILEIFLGLAIFLIIGNTIRLMLMNRQKEIEIMQWVGATNAFIRRPYLYTGLWYGMLGAMMAWIIVISALMVLSGTAQNLLSSYHANFNLLGAGWGIGLNLIFIGAGVGWLSAYLVTQYYLYQGQPRAKD